MHLSMHLLCRHALDVRGPFLHEDPVPAERAANTLEVLVYLHDLLAVRTLVDHLLAPLDGLTDGTCHRLATRCLG
jgi:hypothetical protein